MICPFTNLSFVKMMNSIPKLHYFDRHWLGANFKAANGRSIKQHIACKCVYFFKKLIYSPNVHFDSKSIWQNTLPYVISHGISIFPNVIHQNIVNKFDSASCTLRRSTIFKRKCSESKSKHCIQQKKFVFFCLVTTVTFL